MRRLMLILALICAPLLATAEELTVESAQACANKIFPTIADNPEQTINHVDTVPILKAILMNNWRLAGLNNKAKRDQWLSTLEERLAIHLSHWSHEGQVHFRAGFVVSAVEPRRVGRDGLVTYDVIGEINGYTAELIVSYDADKSCTLHNAKAAGRDMTAMQEAFMKEPLLFKLFHCAPCTELTMVTGSE